MVYDIQISMFGCSIYKNYRCWKFPSIDIHQLLMPEFSTYRYTSTVDVLKISSIVSPVSCTLTRRHKTGFSNAYVVRLTWISRSRCAIVGPGVHHSPAEFPTFPPLYPDPMSDHRADFRTGRTIRVETVSYGRTPVFVEFTKVKPKCRYEKDERTEAHSIENVNDRI